MIRFGAVLTVVVVAMGLLAGGVLTNNLLLVYLAIGVAALSAVMLAVGLVVWRGDIFGEASAKQAAAPAGLAARTAEIAGTAGVAGTGPAPVGLMPAGQTAPSVALGQSTLLVAGGSPAAGRDDPGAPSPFGPPWRPEDLAEPEDLHQERPQPAERLEWLERPELPELPERPAEQPAAAGPGSSAVEDQSPDAAQALPASSTETGVPRQPQPEPAAPGGQASALDAAVADAEPASGAEPRAGAGPRAEAKSGAEPPAAAEPQAEAKPPAEAEPQAEAQPTADAEPAGDAEPAADAEQAAGGGRAALGPGAQVTIVPGIARYHRSECILIRFLGPEDLETMTMQAAEDAGCVPCKACRPAEEPAGG